MSEKIDKVVPPTDAMQLDMILEMLSDPDAKLVRKILAEKDAENQRLQANIQAMIVMIGDSWELVQQMNVSFKSIGKTLAPLLQPSNGARRTR